jgi:hypothetical protein
MFVVNSKRYTLAASLRKLRDLKRVSTKEWWRTLEVCQAGEGEKAEPKLKCVNCNVLLTAGNPAQSAKNHQTERGCRGLRRIASADAAAAAAAAADAAASAVSAGASAGGGASTSGSSGGAAGSLLGKRKKGGGGLYATADQQQSFERSLARFFFKNGIPLQLTDDPDLRAAVAHVGLLPPSRDNLSNKLLDEVYNEVRAADDARLAGQRLLQLTTDGWRRRTAARGVFLINVVALLPPGGSVFFKVVAAPGVIKDKAWIKDRHLEWASLITGGELGRLVGMVMDNTKANMYVSSRYRLHYAAHATHADVALLEATHARVAAAARGYFALVCPNTHPNATFLLAHVAPRAALKLLKVEHPEWILLGCAAHAFNLLIKDLGDSKRGRCMWLVRVYQKALMMCNTINNADKVRAALDYQQKRRGDQKVRTISRHTPTRFGTIHLICKDLYRERGPIRAMVSAVDDDGSEPDADGEEEQEQGESARSWAQASKDCEHGDEFYRAALEGEGEDFTWAAMDLAIKLINPISDAIHQLEGDKPQLSWLLPAWVKIITGVRAFEAQHKDCATFKGETEKLVEIVGERFEKHYDTSWAAAHLVDPMFAQQGAQGWYLIKGRESVLTARKLVDALACLKQLAGPGNAAAVQAEFSRLKLAPLPAGMAEDLPALTERRQVEGGGALVASAVMRRGFWDVHSEHFPHIAGAAIKLLSFHVTSCATERNWSVWGRLCTRTTNRRLLERAEKLVTIMASRPDRAAEVEEELLSLLSLASE